MFALQDYISKEILNDEKHVKPLVLISEGDGIEFEVSKIEINTHICTDDDYANLYPMHFKNVNKFNELKD